MVWSPDACAVSCDGVLYCSRPVIKQTTYGRSSMLKRCASDEGVAVSAKKHKSDASSCSEEESDDDSSWVPSSGEEEEECCEHDAISTRSRIGDVAFPSDMGDINAIMDRVDEDVNRESDFSSESEEDDGNDSGEEDSDESDEEESDDDDYSDDDSFVTSDDEPEFAAPVTLARCDAGIPALDDDTPKDSEPA
jgi:hypothetical protein